MGVPNEQAKSQLQCCKVKHICTFMSTSLTKNMSNRMSISPEVNNEPTTRATTLKNSFQQVAKVTTTAAFGAISTSFLQPTMKRAYAADKVLWRKVDLPTKETLFDISFDNSNPDHGWIVGAKGTFLETFDGGYTWKPRSFTSLDENEDDTISYRFEVASLSDDEGWIIGKPSLLLHTRDGGKQFERLPLSPKLPGEPCGIWSLGKNQAEMITTQGAIYNTNNGGLNWKAQVKETIDATLNRVSSSGTSGASFFTGKLANQIRDKVRNKYIIIIFIKRLF
jgi:photosystem II stability/assembly factor-like uncharacterized protein